MAPAQRPVPGDDQPGWECTIRLTAAVEDYLKAILRLGETGGSATAGPVTAAALTGWLGVAASSVTVMTDRLVDHRLALRPARGRVTLTPHGRAHALSVVRRHRLMETYLHRALGMRADEVHSEAEVLEHAISTRLEARLADVLGDPETDPHGSWIPRPVESLECRP